VQPVLLLEKVVKRYGSVPALGPVDIAVEKGEFLTLLGPSGCGKTTTLHIIAGLTTPSEGRLTLEGRDITRLAPPYRDMGLVFQNYALFPHRTIAENVGFGLRMRRTSKPEISDRVGAMLDIVGLPGVEARYPHQLSGGQRQRVALARALVIEPSILLLDEPLSNLDALLRKRMRAELRDIQRRLGITTIFVTHDQDEAFEMSDRVVLMNGGHVEQVGAPDELYDAPQTRFAAEFIGEASLIEGRVEHAAGNEVLVAVGSLGVAARAVRPGLVAGDKAILMVRPERIELAAPGTSGATDLTVASRIFQGDRIMFGLRAEDGLLFHCALPNREATRAIETGAMVGAFFRESRAIPVARA
jgi:ABC-type Fe3+/spermidine/putrescine transport system ATPase subunit